MAICGSLMAICPYMAMYNSLNSIRTPIEY